MRIHDKPSRATLACAMTIALGLIEGCASEETRRPAAELYREALLESRVDRDEAREAIALAQRAERAKPSVEDVPLPPPHAPQPLHGQPVTNAFVETDIREAIQSLATQAGVVVSVDDIVRGSVSASLSEVPFEAALRSIVAPLGYVSRRRGEEYLVGSPLPSSALFSQIAESVEYRPKHLGPAELLELVPTYALPYIRVSTTRNIMVVTAPCPLVHTIVGDFERADQQIPQVLLEAIICVYSKDEGFVFGLDAAGGAETSGGRFANVGMGDLAVTALSGPAGMAGLEAFQFTSAYLRALATEGWITIRASPRVMAQDGERASIAIGEETYFTVGDGQNLFRELKPVRTGIALSIVPRIRGSRVTIKIERAEVSDELRPSTLLPTPDGNLPTVGMRQVSTTVQVMDGQTIVIGGLVQRRKVERRAKLPILGDIPLLGLLFQRVDEREEEVEVAIFISPRIVKEQP